MGKAFARKYSDEQRDALAWAWAERHMRPAERIAALAAAGELRSQTDEPLEAFHVPAQTVRDIGRRYIRRRAGLERSRAAQLPARDAVEQLRRRLVSAAAHELDEVERAQARRREVSPERLRQIARLVRELAALPTDTPALAPKPERGKDTRGGLAGAILRAARTSSAPSPVDEPTPRTSDGGDKASGYTSAEDGERGNASERINATPNERDEAAPGTGARAESPGLAVIRPLELPPAA